MEHAISGLSPGDPAGPTGESGSGPAGNGHRGSGNHENGAVPRRPRAAVPSAKPALVIVGIAAGLVLLFGIGSVLSGSGSPAPAKRAGAHVKGATLKAEGAVDALRPIERPGTPPSDVLRSIVVPKGSAAVSSKPWDGTTQFSGEMTFRLDTSQASVVSFYRAELSARGWSISSVGAAEGHAGSTEVLAQRASSDGWYWEIGVVVSPTSFSSTARATSDDVTRFRLDLFQEPDTG